MTPDRLLMLLAAEAGRDGYVCPQLDSDQAKHAAERLLAAVGLARVTPQPALPAARVDSPTRELRVVTPGARPGPYPPHGPRRHTYAGGRS